MKKLIGILLMAALCLGLLAGCGGSGNAPAATEAPAETEGEAAETPDLLAQIKEKGELTIAMEGTWSPWTYHNEDDELVGYDVEVGQYIAEYIGVEAKFVEGEWSGLFAGMDSGRYDIVINGVDITADRSEKYDFSEPYAYDRTALVVRQDNEDIQSFEDLDGKKTANSIGSTYMELGEQYGASCEGVESLGETMQMVEAGRVDATLNAESSVADYFNAQPDAPLKIVAYTAEANRIAIPVRKGDDTASFLAAVDEAIAAMRKDGTLQALSEKYFNMDLTQPPVEK